MFKLHSPFAPAGDQTKAIKQLINGLQKGMKMQTLLGVTGSGKTFTMANVIERYNKPTIVLAHNKTLAFQLYRELKEFFPENKVEFFISYYDYYQPESYMPTTDTYIEKDAKINPKIELLRLAATTSLLSRNDTIIVSSVSCIYSLGDPKPYKEMAFKIKKGETTTRKKLLQKLLNIQYQRNDTELLPGRFRVKGSTVDIIPGYLNNLIRVSFQGNNISNIQEYSLPDVELITTHDIYDIFPARHFVVEKDVVKKATDEMKFDLKQRLPDLEETNALFAHRLKQKINYDIEMINEMGYCSGIENYSRYFDGRVKGQRPYCLLDYFPKDFLMIIDESHQMIPQLNAMYKGDKSRKQNLVDYGFRLPSALDNRPLKFEEIEPIFQNTVFVSATPGNYEREHSQQIVEQIIRPTGLIDPIVTIRPSQGQMQNLINEIKNANKKSFRTLITTLTKRLAEELTEFLANNGIRVRYLHSEIDSLERVKIIRQLRLKKFDVLVGINLLREGLDIPEVGLVAILDADKEGFLRNDKSLIQTIGRAARNSESKVILYADKETDSIIRTIKETTRRRNIQIAYNKKYGITPKTIIKEVGDDSTLTNLRSKDEFQKISSQAIPRNAIPATIIELEAMMKKAATELDFETAIKLRNNIKELKQKYDN